MIKISTTMSTKYTTKTLLAILISGFLFYSCQNESTQADKTDNIPASVPELESLNNAVNENASDPDAYIARAMYYYERSAFDLAEKDLLKALEIDSTRPSILHMLADTYMDNYQSRKGLKTMEKAASQFPERIPTLLKLSEYQLILKQYEEALKTVDRIMKIDPQSSEAFFMSGIIFREMGDINRAINSFQRSTELNPDNMDAWIILGNLFDQQDNPIALQYFDNAIRVAPDNPFAMHSKAYYLQNHGKSSEAIQLYKEINKAYPDYIDAYLNTGILYLTLDSLELAHEHFNIAVSNGPTDPRGYYFRGLISEQLGEYEKAKRDYEQALVFDPDYREAKEALELLGLREKK